jgi:phage FluMu protein Com
MDNKENIIKWIAQRIKDEQKKHENNIPDWYEIAARKIYATYDIKLKQEEVDVICPKCKGVNEYIISDKGDYKCAYTDCQHKFKQTRLI